MEPLQQNEPLCVRFRKARVKRDGRWFKAVASPNVVRKGGGLEGGGEKNQKNRDLQATSVPLGCFKSMVFTMFSSFFTKISISKVPKT